MMRVREGNDKLLFLTVYLPKSWFNRQTQVIFNYKPNSKRVSTSEYSWVTTTAPSKTHSLAMYANDDSIQCGFYYSHKPSQAELESLQVDKFELENSFGDDNSKNEEFEAISKRDIMDQLFNEADSWKTCLKSKNIVVGLKKCNVFLPNEEVTELYASATAAVDARKSISMAEISKLMFVKELETEKLPCVTVKQMFYIMQCLNIEMKSQKEGKKNWIDSNNVCFLCVFVCITFVLWYEN